MVLKSVRSKVSVNLL